MTTEEQDKQTLHKIIEAFAFNKIPSYQQDMIDVIASGEPIVVGIDHSGDRDRSIAAIASITGNGIDFIIIDEVGSMNLHEMKTCQGMMGINLNKSLHAMRELDWPDPAPLEPDTTMIKKGNQMMKRHHPIPQTPRSPRRRK